MTKSLTKEELLGVQSLWHRMPDVSILEVLHDSEVLAPYFAELKNHSVIEIGPGDNPVTNYFPCGEYRSSEGYYPKDGLSMLRTMGDRSAVVVSFGVVDDDVLVDKLTPARQQLCVRYINELVEHIRRVMNPFAIIIGSGARKYLGEPDLVTLISDPDMGGVYLQK